VDAATRHGWRAGVLLAEGTFEDPKNARVIYIAAGGLLLLALLLAVGTWWWWRSAKVEHPALGPLEVMGSRSWRNGDFNNRVKTIEQARPANAIHEAELAEPDELDLEAIDLAAMSRAEPAHFGDFSDLLPAEPSGDAAASGVAVAVIEAPVVDPSHLEQPEVDESTVDAPDADASTAAKSPADVLPSEPAPDSPAADPAPVVEVAAASAPIPEPDPVALQLAFDEPLPQAASAPIDPLLRPNTDE
jgi:hypothetical protein